MTEVTHGHLLNGRVRYTQPARGFRSGIEPVLLAASVPARAGQRVLEAGTGAGAGLLCLLSRVPCVNGVGIEIDPAQADLARANTAANGMTSLHVVAGDLEAGMPDGMFDHAFANPPYHPAAGTVSANVARATAKRGTPGLLVTWATALGERLRPRGTLTMSVPASALPQCMQALSAAGCPAEVILPLWPKSAVPAKLVLIRGIKGGRGPLRLLPGLVLHQEDGRFTPAADSVLRDGAALDLDH